MLSIQGHQGFKKRYKEAILIINIRNFSLDHVIYTNMNVTPTLLISIDNGSILNLYIVDTFYDD